MSDNYQELPRKGEVSGIKSDFMKYGDIIMLIFEPNSQMKVETNMLSAGETNHNPKFKIGGLSATGYISIHSYI